MLVAHSAAFTGQPLSGVVVRTSPARSRMRRTCRARPREVVTCSSRPLLSPNAALTTGAALLTTVLTNRLLFTSIDDLYPPQSRSDIIAVIASATLVLYGLGRAEVAERRAAVDMGGVDVVPASDSAFRALPDSARAELEWSADAVLDAMPTFKSVAVVVGDATVFRRGRFRAPDSVPVVPAGGIADNVRKSAERAYLADLKVVPVKEVEFAFFPENCQSIVIQPVGDDTLFILGGDRPRPMTGPDFGWLQAVTDRLGAALSASRPASGAAGASSPEAA